MHILMSKKTIKYETYIDYNTIVHIYLLLCK